MNKRILIVDDETNVRLNFRTTLETEGYEVVEASSGRRDWARWPSIYLRSRSSTFECLEWTDWNCWPRCGRTKSGFQR